MIYAQVAHAPRTVPMVNLQLLQDAISFGVSFSNSLRFHGVRTLILHIQIAQRTTQTHARRIVLDTASAFSEQPVFEIYGDGVVGRRRSLGEDEDRFPPRIPAAA